MSTFQLIRFAGLAIAFALAPGLACAQSALDGFRADANGTVHAIARDEARGFLLGGAFTNVAGLTRRGIARLDHAGAIDPAFNPNVTAGEVRALAVDGDGRILLGGSFHAVGGQDRTRLARLQPDGTPDGFTAEVDDIVHAIAIDVDGTHAYVGGAFEQVNGAARPRLARLDANGVVDAGFDPPDFTGVVHAIAVQPDGRVLVGGTIGLGGSHPIDHRLYRLMPDGSLDAGFSARVDTLEVQVVRVNAIALRGDGRILVGGQFGRVGMSARANFAQLLEDGSVDAGYDPPQLSAQVHAIAVQPDGRAVIAGDFTGLSLRSRVARLRHDGSLDSAFGLFVDPDAAVRALALEDNGAVVLGGQFDAITGLARARIARLLPNGLPESDFTPPAFNDIVAVSATQADGRVVVGGRFTTVDGAAHRHLARLGPVGSLDANFTPDPNGPVYAIAIQDDGKLVVGGGFDTIGGAPQRGVARLFTDGSADPAFAQLDANGTVRAIATFADNRLLVAGDFTAIGGFAREHVAVLHPDGSVDAAFDAGAINGRINAVGLLADGHIAIGGAFTSVQGESRARLALLHPTGELVAGITMNANGEVHAIAPISSASASPAIFAAGGDFTLINGQARSRAAILRSNGMLTSWNPLFNGRVESISWIESSNLLLSGAFTQIDGEDRAGVAVMTNDGLASFDAGVELAAGSVWSANLQADGKIVLAGDFGAVGGVARANLARVSAWGSLRHYAVYLPDPEWVALLHTGFVPGGFRADLLVSQTCCDDADFVPHPDGSAMISVAGGWRLPYTWQPVGTWYIKARLRHGDGRGTVPMPSTITEVVGAPIEPDDILFRDGFDASP